MILVGLSLFTLSFAQMDIDEDESNPISIPKDFEILRSAVGVALYRKNYANGVPDFVQVINLNQGARLVLLHGEIKTPGFEKGAFGGNDPSLNSRLLSQYWKQLSASYKNAFCITNGQFFYMLEHPTRLPFPLKVDGHILSSGYAKQEFPRQKLLLQLWQDRADIQILTKESLFDSTAPNIIGGLTEDARKSPTKYVARTFIGISDQDRDGKYETILIFNTQSARQVDAADVLRSFGAEKVMMLDGGGSTQLLCQDFSYINSERVVPQAIGVVAGRFVAPEKPDLSTSNAVHIEISEDAQVQHQGKKTTTAEPISINKPKKTQVIHADPLPSLTPYSPPTLISGSLPGVQGFPTVVIIPLVIILLAPVIFYLIKNRR